MLNKIKNLFKRKFVQDIATLQIGTFFSAGLTFIGSVVFARVLGPQDYGRYVLIFVLVTLIQTFMHWGADYATLTLLAAAWAKKDKQEIKNIVIFFIKLTLIISLTIGLVALFLSPSIAGRLYQDSQIGLLARWVLLAGIARIMFSLILVILQVVRRIRHLAVFENINKIIYIIIPVAFVFLGFGLQGIVWGYFLSALFFLIFSLYFYSLLLNKTDLLPNFKEIFSGLKTLKIKKYFKFGFLIAVDKNLSTLYSTLPLFFLGIFVSDVEVGYFKIAFSYLGLALLFLKPVSRLLMVQLPKSKIYGFQELRSHFYKSTWGSVLIIILILVPMLLLSKFLVTIFYGHEYLASINIIYILWPYILAAALGIGLSSLFRTLNKMRVAIISNLIILITTTPVVYFLIKTYALTGMVISIISWTFVPILVLQIYFYNYFRKIKYEKSNLNQSATK